MTTTPTPNDELPSVEIIDAAYRKVWSTVPHADRLTEFAKEIWQAARSTPPGWVMVPDAEIEALAIKHEAFGFGRVDEKGLTTHGFDPDGLREFARELMAIAAAPLPPEPAGADK